MELEILKKVNALLADLNQYSHKPGDIKNELTHDGLGSYGESQGDYNETTKLFKTPFEGIALKVVVRTDSYRYNNYTASVEFVKTTAKDITVYTSEKL